MARTEKSGGARRNGEAAAAFRAVQLHHGALDPAPAGRGFGSGALKVGGKIFASLSSGDRLLLKLPAARVDALIAQGAGERFTTGPGRPKREWITIGPSHASLWIALSDEARAFVAGGPGD